MNQTTDSTRSYRQHMAFTGVCVFSFIGGMVLLASSFHLMDEIYQPSIIVGRIVMTVVPTAAVATVIWKSSNAWYGRKTARRSTLALTLLYMATYYVFASFLTMPII